LLIICYQIERTASNKSLATIKNQQDYEERYKKIAEELTDHIKEKCASITAHEVDQDEDMLNNMEWDLGDILVSQDLKKRSVLELFRTKKKPKKNND